MSVALYAFLISLSGGCIFFAGMTGEEIAARKTKELRARIQQTNELVEQKREENNKLYLAVKSLEKSLREKDSSYRSQLQQQKKDLSIYYIQAVGEIEKDLDYHKSLLQQKQEELRQKESQLKADFDSLFLSKINQLSSNYEGKIKIFLEQERKTKAQLQTQLDKALLELGEWQEKSPNFDRRQLELDRQQAEIEVERRELDGQYRLYQQEASLTTDQFQRQINSYEQQIEQAMSQIQQLTQALMDSEQVEVENRELKQIISNLESELAEYVPKLPSDAVDIMRLLASEDIKTEFIDNVNRGGVEIYRFKPLTKISQIKLDTVCENLPAMFDWIDSRPTATVRKGEIIINVDTRTVNDRIDQVQREWLPNLAQTESNLAIFGAKGGGKSELAINYISLILEQIPSAKIEWIQPKPDDFSRFEINGNYYKPNFVGFEDGYNGLNKIVELYQHRNAINTEAFKSDKPTPKWSPVFWIIDEFQSLIAEASKFDYDPKQICKDIQTAVSLGRSLQINILLIGQIANVSIYPGWTKASYYQFNTIYLGDMIGVGASYSLTSEERKRIEMQLSDYRNSGEKFYALVREANKSGSIMRLPKPKQYVKNEGEITYTNPAPSVHRENQVQKQESPEPLHKVSGTSYTSHAPGTQKLQNSASECPECGSFDLRKKGKTSTGKQRLNCKRCGHNFTVEAGG